MAGTILPIVYGETDLKKTRLLAAVHALAYPLAAALGGAAFAALGVMLAPILDPRLAVVGAAVACALCSLRELGLAPVPSPQFSRQVPASWRALPPVFTMLLYGMGLGVGVATRIPVSTFYVVVIWCVLRAAYAPAALAMALFGAGRALPLLWMSTHYRSRAECDSAVSTCIAWKPVLHLLNGAALGFAASWLLSEAARPA
jgi:hypothetical protein